MIFTEQEKIITACTPEVTKVKDASIITRDYIHNLLTMSLKASLSSLEAFFDELTIKVNRTTIERSYPPNTNFRHYIEYTIGESYYVLDFKSHHKPLGDNRFNFVLSDPYFEHTKHKKQVETNGFEYSEAMVKLINEETLKQIICQLAVFEFNKRLLDERSKLGSPYFVLQLECQPNRQEFILEIAETKLVVNAKPNFFLEYLPSISCDFSQSDLKKLATYTIEDNLYTYLYRRPFNNLRSYFKSLGGFALAISDLYNLTKNCIKELNWQRHSPYTYVSVTEDDVKTVFQKRINDDGEEIFEPYFVVDKENNFSPTPVYHLKEAKLPDTEGNVYYKEY